MKYEHKSEKSLLEVHNKPQLYRATESLRCGGSDWDEYNTDWIPKTQC